MAIYNAVYENEVLESAFKDNLTTALNVRTLMKLDTSLAENAGMIKRVHTYTYAGAAENVGENAGNTAGSIGRLSFTVSNYEVGVKQHTFKYTDEEFMQDNNVVDFGIKGASSVMVNDLIADFYAELEKATLTQDYVSFNYNVVVDAIEQMNLEDEAGLSILIGTDLKAAVRKDPDFKAANQGEILTTGAFGFISGIPVIVSKAVPTATAYVLSSEAVTLFAKKEVGVEQDRDIEKRANTVVFGKVALVALTDATKIVKIAKTAV